MAKRIFPLLVLGVVIGMAANGRAQIVANGSFEQPGSATDQYTVTFQTLPTDYVTGWTLGTSGVTYGNGNAYDGICGGNGFAAGNYEDGSNCIFLQGGMAATTVTLTAGSYTLSFWAMGRVNAGNGANPIAVTVGNANGNISSNTVTPLNTGEDSLSDWTQYLFNFTAPSDGAYQLTFQATIPYGPSGDHTTFIDNVAITPGGIAPSFGSQPTPEEMVYVGGTGRFSAQASGSPAPSYQWQIESNGVFINLTNSSRISGATNSTLTISNLVAGDATNYQVLASNTSGSATSSVAQLIVVPAPTAGSYDSAVFAQHPVAYYPLNETADPSSGTAEAFDFSGGFNGVYGASVLNGFDGTVGPTPSDGFPGFPADNVAALLPSPSGEITLAPWQLNTNTVTFTAWIFPIGVQNPFAGLIYILGGPDGSGFNFTGGGNVDTNGNSTLGYTWNFDGGTYGWNSMIAPPQAQWSFVALVITPTNATVYILNTNGVLIASQNHVHPVEPFSAAPQFGFFPGQANNDAFNGSMADVAIFGQSLSGLQIAELYAAAAGSAPPVPPSITSEPTPSAAVLYAGETARFTAQAVGIPAPYYQWKIQSNGVFVNLNNSSRISGVNGTTLTISNVSAGDVTNYLLTVTNTFGSTNSSIVSLAVTPPPAAGSYASAVLADNPWAYYELNETNDPSTGTAVAYDFVGGFNGIYGTSVQNGFNGVVGPFPSDGFPDFPTNNTAALFPAPDPTSAITLAPWGINTNAVTFTAWINPAGQQTPFAGLIYVVGADGLGFNFTPSADLNGNETLGYSWNYDPNTFNWDSGIAPPPGQWSFVALVVTPTNATVYIINTNGTLSNSLTYNHVIEPFSSTTMLGAFPNGDPTYNYHGSMDHVAIFGQALSDKQIAALYNTAAGVTQAVTLGVAHVGANVVLTWPGGGQLLQAPSILGPWTTNSAASSPYQITPSTPQMYYRVQVK
ncbi:MAG TPA: LamG-like jellyroll fold domain-containing protein [Verrucomicrobiae bacterium]|nr:LamG-like jellyroll fold domain-containing protein [Verrucomicrobiae bacterium]